MDIKITLMLEVPIPADATADADFLRALADDFGVAAAWGEHAATCKRLREIAERIESDNERHGRFVKAVGELAGMVCDE